MANAYSIDPPTALQSVHPSFSELFRLLPKLLACPYHEAGRFTTDNVLLQTILQHIGNSAYLVLSGVQSLGTLLAAAANNDDMHIATKDISNLGWLIHILGNWLEACNALEASISAELTRREAKPSK